MKITYEFDPIEDAHRLRLHEQADEMYNMLFDVYTRLRNDVKYGDKVTIDLLEFKQWFNDLLVEYRIDLP